MQNLRVRLFGFLEFDDMKAGTEMSGVGKGAELGDGFGIAEFTGFDHLLSEVGEVAALGGEMGGLPADGFCLAREIGEIDMGGDISFSRINQRILCCLMFVKSAQGAAGAVRVVVFRCGESVINKEQHSISDAVRNPGQELSIVRADLGLVVFRKRMAKKSGFLTQS